MRHWLAALLVLALGATAQAAPDGQDSTSPAASRRSPDFFFGRPDGSFGIRGSWIFNRAGSDWYDFVTDQLTIDKGALNAPAVTFEVGVSLTPRLDVVAGVDVSSASTTSEYRRYVDNNRLPITQKTELAGTTISGSLRYALIPRGREVGSLARAAEHITTSSRSRVTSSTTSICRSSPTCSGRADGRRARTSSAALTSSSISAYI